MYIYDEATPLFHISSRPLRKRLPKIGQLLPRAPTRATGLIGEVHTHGCHGKRIHSKRKLQEQRRPPSRTRTPWQELTSAPPQAAVRRPYRTLQIPPPTRLPPAPHQSPPGGNPAPSPSALDAPRQRSTTGPTDRGTRHRRRPRGPAPADSAHGTIEERLPDAGTGLIGHLPYHCPLERARAETLVGERTGPPSPPSRLSRRR